MGILKIEKVIICNDVCDCQRGLGRAFFFFYLSAFNQRLGIDCLTDYKTLLFDPLYQGASRERGLSPKREECILSGQAYARSNPL